MMRAHRRVHALVWTILALLLPLALGVSLIAGRPDRPADEPAVRLDGPAPEGAR